MIREIKPLPKQHEAWEAFMNPTITDILYGGGAGGGKSYCACQMALVTAYELPGSTTAICRKELTTLMKTTYPTMLEVMRHLEIPASDWRMDGKYNLLEFNNGSKIYLLDVAYKPTDPNFDRFGGLLLTHAFGEEIAEWNKKAWEVLQTRIGRNNIFDINGERTEVKGKFFGTANPSQNWVKSVYIDPTRKGTMPTHRKFISALATDNHHLPEAYIQQLQNIEDPVTRQRLLEGNWDYQDSEGVIMKMEHINDIFTNTIIKENQKYLVIDPALQGKDTAVFNLWEGLESVKIEQIAKIRGDQLLQKTKDYAIEHKIPYSNILVDAGGGYGAPIIDFMPGVQAFVGNTTAFKTERMVRHQYIPKAQFIQADQAPRANFKSMKDQCGFKLAEMVTDHKIACSAPGDWSDLVQEMSQVKMYKPDEEGKLRITPKKDIKENIGRSPDLLDTFIMRMWFELRKDTETRDVYRADAVAYRPAIRSSHIKKKSSGL